MLKDTIPTKESSEVADHRFDDPLAHSS